jgi:hypothetical protein
MLSPTGIVPLDREGSSLWLRSESRRAVCELDRFSRFCYNMNSTEDKSPIWFDYLEETRARR